MVPNFHDFILFETQIIIFEGLKLGITITVSISEFKRLIKLLSFFKELYFEKISFRFDSHRSNFKFSL
jgi:hypothetical protein